MWDSLASMNPCNNWWGSIMIGEAATKWSGSLTTIKVITSQLWNRFTVSRMWGSFIFVRQTHNRWGCLAIAELPHNWWTALQLAREPHDSWGCIITLRQPYKLDATLQLQGYISSELVKKPHKCTSKYQCIKTNVFQNLSLTPKTKSCSVLSELVSTPFLDLDIKTLHQKYGTSKNPYICRFAYCDLGTI